jgi:hypothetical protein
MQTATLPTTPNQNARNLSGDKETIQTLNAVAYDRAHDAIRTYITVHIYASRSAGHSGQIHASIWCHHAPCPTSGYGKAGGYGYHKPSAALQAAIRSVGITLAQPIEGRGEQAMEKALRAIAIAQGADQQTVTII